MKMRRRFGSMVNLLVSATSSLTIAQLAIAAPAPIFKPIIKDIQNQLPRGMVMRLPSSLELIGFDGKKVDLYLILEPDRGEELRISFVTEPNCRGRYCEVGYIASFQPSLNRSEFVASLGADEFRHTARITLKTGVIGTYVYANTGGATGVFFGVVIWEQDGQSFVVSLPIGDQPINKQKILDTAISMANEPSVRSAR